MSEQAFYGWFDDASQATPSVEPPFPGPCFRCGRVMSEDDVRSINLMPVNDDLSRPYAARAYFYRIHRTCAIADTRPNGSDLDILDMIARNGD